MAHPTMTFVLVMLLIICGCEAIEAFARRNK